MPRIRTFFISFLCILIVPVWVVAATATPSDYGYTTPIPEPTLPSQFDAFAPPLLGSGSGPAVAEFTRSASPDDIITIAGPSFTSSSTFRFFGQTTGSSVLVDRGVTSADGNVASTIVPTQLPSWSSYIVWPKNGSTYGLPFMLNRTDAWWMTDEATVGSTASIYGRNLSHENGTSTSYVYIKPVGNVSGQWVTPTAVNPYKVDFTVPSLSTGTYEVWAHNGHGGSFGWSGPQTFSVISNPFAGQSSNVFNVKTSYGAVGNGIADDTTAIQNAIAAAAAAAPATVYFPAGTYLVNESLSLGNNVSWLGDGKDTTFIKASSAFAGDSDTTPLVFAVEYTPIHNVEIKNITIDANGNLGTRRIFQFRLQDNMKITNSRMSWIDFPFIGPSFSGTTHLTITDSEFIGDGIFLGSASNVSIDGTTFRMTDYADSAITSWGGENIAVTDNHAEDYDLTSPVSDDTGSGRFFTSQSHPDSNRNFYIAENTTTNFSPLDNSVDTNQGEQILFEVGSSPFFASPTSASATTATFSSAPPTEGTEYPGQPLTSRDALIVKGKGVGQRRYVTGVSGNTITVSPAWSVVPDSTSVIGVGSGQFNSVVYSNTFDGKSNYSSLETASTGMQMYGNVTDVIFSNNTLTDLRSAINETSQKPTSTATMLPSSLFFNLIEENTITGAYNGFIVVTNEIHHNHPGVIGHLGNSYRDNALTNIIAHGIALLSEWEGYTGGDVDQNNFAHNSFTNVPTAVWQHRAYSFSNAAVNTNFSNINLYKNTFNRGSATFSGSKAIDLLGSTTSFWRATDTWSNFETSTTDPDTAAVAALVDTTGPILSSIAANVTALATTITWTSDEVASTQVEYGTTTSYGSISTLDASLALLHTALLTSLDSCTTYHYRVLSTDAEGNTTTSGDNSFSTSGCGSSGGGGGGGGGTRNPTPTVSSLVVPPITSPTATTPILTPTTTAPSSYAFTTNLSLGSKGIDVLLLQKYLNNNGFIVASAGFGSPGNESSVFGPATKAAVMKFQQAKGIVPVSGIVGPITRSVINSGAITNIVPSSTPVSFVTVTATKLKVRLSPVYGAVLALVSRGDTGTITQGSLSDSWVKVKFATVEGWVSRAFIQ
jgi:hypothetical protein